MNKKQVMLAAVMFAVSSLPAVADTRIEAIKRFVAQCDITGSDFTGTVAARAAEAGSRISSAPYKYVGKKVCLYGLVDSTIDESHWNLKRPGFFSDENDLIITSDTRNLGKGDIVWVQGIVIKPVHGERTTGGSDLFGAIQAKFVESDDEYGKIPFPTPEPTE